jgi:hypothetical protein
MAVLSGFASRLDELDTITVPALRQSFGPFLLTDGVTNAWTPCLYPGSL